MYDVPHFSLNIIHCIQQIICEKQDVFPSATAVARAYPLYSRKTNLSSKLGATSAEKVPIAVSVEYFLLDNAIPLTEDECLMLERAAESVRLTARIVDTPCNEMNTDHFLEVNKCLIASGNLMILLFLLLYYLGNRNSCQRVRD